MARFLYCMGSALFYTVIIFDFIIGIYLSESLNLLSHFVHLVEDEDF